LDVVELHLGSGDPKASLAAAKYILQGTRPLGEIDLPMGGPTTPEGVEPRSSDQTSWNY